MVNLPLSLRQEEMVTLIRTVEEPLPGCGHQQRDLMRGFQLRKWAVCTTACVSLVTLLVHLTTANLGWSWEPSSPRPAARLLEGASPQFVKIPGGLCVDEWKTIESKEVCEKAARSLGLRATRAASTVFGQRPTGCYLVRNTRADQVTLWMNVAPPDLPQPASGNGFGDIQGWVPEPICRKKPATMSVEERVVEHTDNRQDLTTSAPDEGDSVVCRYVVGAATEPSCPKDSVPLNSSECRTMPYHFGGTLHVPFEESAAMDPPGCFFFGANYYFNTHPVGGASPGRKLYCKHCQNMPKVHVGDWSDWGSDRAQTMAANAKANARFRKIDMGKCTDSGMHPIRSKSACEEASKYLALLDSTASITAIPERPDGCYYYRNYQDGTETLWLGISPLSHGNGAETSNLAQGGLRQPICSEERLEGTAAEGWQPETFTMPPPVNYRKISAGRCADTGSSSIVDLATCEEAARNLGLVDIVATSLSLPTYPEGCYYFWNSGDLTSTLWLNISPLATGNGAQVATGMNHGLRQPLCKSTSSTGNVLGMEPGR